MNITKNELNPGQCSMFYKNSFHKLAHFLHSVVDLEQDYLLYLNCYKALIRLSHCSHFNVR